MYDYSIIRNGLKPIKLSSTRAWRTYLGGKLIDELYGLSDPKDCHFPEEWIMSIVSARNKGREHIKDEGLSRLDTPNNDTTLKELIDSNPREFLGNRHFETFGNQTGVLVKIIDSAERLTVQVHPDRIKSLELFNSNYGKTESWHILGGREIDGEPPCVYLGFKPGVIKEQWEELFSTQDIQGMLNCMHKYYVQPGDTFLIEAGTPHAIGAGCFLVEIQEPTDYTIRVEQTTPSGFKLDDFMCHQGIGFEKMFDCFKYETYSREETSNKWNIVPSLLSESNDSREFELIGYQNTPYYRMTLIEAKSEIEINGDDVFSGLFIISGHATIVANGESQSIIKGEQFFIPANVSRFTIKNDGDEDFKALRFFGPKVL